MSTNHGDADRVLVVEDDAHVREAVERALRFGASLDERERFELLVRCSRAMNFEGRMDDALHAATQATAIAERDLGAHEHGRALSVLVAALWSLDGRGEGDRSHRDQSPRGYE